MTIVCFEYRTDMRIAEKYKIIKKIGSGAFGEIYKGKLPKDLKVGERGLEMDGWRKGARPRGGWLN